MSLKTRIGEGFLLAPGVYDALSALLAQRGNAEAVYLSGASIAYTRFGRPDIGLVTMTEVAEVIAAIADRIDIPMIVDADNGFGNALNVQRTVRTFERAGAAALQLEDQTMPKRCGHLAGKTLIPNGEMVGKIRAACDARTTEETLVVARTDAIAVEGFEPALARAESYLEAGADVLFIEAPRTLNEMRTITKQFGGRIPLLANMVEGGHTPVLNAKELEEIGYTIAIFPGGAVRFLAAAAAEYYESLVSTGSNAAMANRMHDFGSLNDVIGTDDMLALGKTYEGIS
ncbi:MAG: isocitrate lyase/phosphoenolpyruvate mutase family protein [Paracoccaceae bacterium]|nr:isocitrate lyase/phosphoenolpyruvate mutase family protein [Paracoccaceae bacterium]MDG1373676.1 isocitrate lyase/phosphoenolpyruvate mutase family protein [Paracoccaceae bacterium]